MLFSGARCCHLFRIQLFLQLSHQLRQHFLRIPLPYPSALGPATSPASMAVHTSFENCYPSSRSISLFTCDCTVECVDQGSSSPSLIGDRPSHPIYRLFTSVTNLSHCTTELSAEKWS